jgi:acetylornithine deacetylase
MDLFELTKSLVNMASVTGHEKACGEFVKGHLSQLGFQAELMPVSRDRSNVFATWGKPDVVLSTHMDTVPPFFPAHEDAEHIYGRGSCDAKGILAAQVTAAERLVIGSKGNLRIDIRARGKMAHSAYPHLGVNAIDKLLDVLEEIRKIPLPVSPVLGPSTMNIGVITAGRAANVVPDEAVAQILIRIVDDVEPLRQKLTEIVGDRCELVVVRTTPVLLMEKLKGYETDVVAFTTDLPSLTNWGRPLLLGPGSITTAHTERECVRKADLMAAADLYYRLVCDLKDRETVEGH